MSKGQVKNLSSRIERLLRIMHPYEIKSVGIATKGNRVRVMVEYGPMAEAIKNYVDDSVSVHLENFMVGNGGLCVDHIKMGRGHAYEYAMA